MTAGLKRTKRVADHDVLKLDAHALVQAVAPLRHGGQLQIDKISPRPLRRAPNKLAYGGESPPRRTVQQQLM